MLGIARPLSQQEEAVFGDWWKLENDLFIAGGNRSSYNS